MLAVILTACINIAVPPEEPDNGETGYNRRILSIKENTKYSYEGEGNEFATYVIC